MNINKSHLETTIHLYCLLAVSSKLHDPSYLFFDVFNNVCLKMYISKFLKVKMRKVLSVGSSDIQQKESVTDILVVRSDLIGGITVS